MFIKIGKSWVFNTDHVKCFGISLNGKDIIVEYTGEKESDTVQINDKEEAHKIFDELTDALGALPYRPMTKSLPQTENNNDGRISASKMIEAFNSAFKED